MTFVTLRSKLTALIYHNAKRVALFSIKEIEEMECPVFFDIPSIPGSTKCYKIVSVSEKGIMIYNPDVEHPAGHSVV